jgi:hypothetical protein
MDSKEFEALLKCPGNVRYEYFIKKIADYESVWGLYDAGWATSCNESGKTLVPFWPKREFANYCAINEWEGYSAKEIELDAFLNRWIPGIKKDNYEISIFSNNIDAIEVEPEVLAHDILQELEKY